MPQQKNSDEYFHRNVWGQESALSALAADQLTSVEVSVTQGVPSLPTQFIKLAGSAPES